MIQRLSSRPDADSDTDADLEVNTESLLIRTLGVGVGIAIGVESQYIQTAAKTVHLSIVDNRINHFTLSTGSNGATRGKPGPKKGEPPNRIGSDVTH